MPSFSRIRPVPAEELPTGSRKSWNFQQGMEKDVFEDSIELQNLLDTAESQTEGIIAKGIRALRMMADGYTSREIGEQMETSANNVTAWIIKSTKILKIQSRAHGTEECNFIKINLAPSFLEGAAFFVYAKEVEDHADSILPLRTVQQGISYGRKSLSL